MQYKSARPCFSIFSNKKLLVCGTAFAVSLFAASFALALTAIPVSKGSTANQLQNGLNTSSFYYPIYVTNQNAITNTPKPIPTFGVIDPLFNFLDLGQDSDPTGNPQTEDGVIYFKINSTKASFSAQAYIAVSVGGASGTAANALVPITGTDYGSGGGVSGCGGPGTQCVNNGTAVTSPYTHQNYYYLVPYNSGETVVVAISPMSICQSMLIQNNATNAACSGSPFLNSTIATTSDVSPSPMTINFSLYLLTDMLSPITTIPTNTAQDGPVAANLNFESLNPTGVTPLPTPTPTASCNLAQDGTYQPVDGGFQLLPNAAQKFAIIGDPAQPTPNQLIAIAAKVPTPLATTVATYTNNPGIPNGIVTPFLLNSTQAITGFTDSDDPNNPIFYTLGFLLEDSAGFIFDDSQLPPGTTGRGVCTFPYNFDTSTVQGFLSQSKCFIATAAFRDLNSTPLVLLRAFRDRFLEKFSLGRSFVHWYYAWSPDAAEWLIDHPIFRFPILLALIPLQAFAWLILHPMSMMAVMLMAASVILWGTLLRRSIE